MAAYQRIVGNFSAGWLCTSRRAARFHTYHAHTRTHRTDGTCGAYHATHCIVYIREYVEDEFIFIGEQANQPECV